MSIARVNRREVLAGAGLALVSGVLRAATAGAAPVGMQTTESTGLVVLHDQRLPLPAQMQRHLDEQGTRVIALEADPVRMWRGAQAALLAAPATRLLGITSWPQFLMVRGLAEESGRRVRQQRLDAASGAIVWLIA